MQYLKGKLCRAHSSKSGKPCRNHANTGTTVCKMHGGSAPQVKRKANERVREALADLIDPDRILREIASLAYVDIRNVFGEDGQLLPMSQWPDDVAAAVASVETTKRNLDPDDGKIDDILKLKVWDKPKALEMLAKHRGLLIEKVEISGTVGVMETRLNAGRERVARARGK